MRAGAACIVLFALAAAPALAEASDNWAALASDRVAHRVGDSLTVIVYENATASDTAANAVNRTSGIQGQLSAGNPSTTGSFNEAANLSMAHASDASGTTSRAGTMVAQVSVLVDAVLPNGDLHVAGARDIAVNGETTRISVAGRVRPEDISAGNAILSTSLADAAIVYSGEGIVSSGSRPGILTRVLSWLGLP
jgi:flagellar L-ring protein FlgH